MTTINRFLVRSGADLGVDFDNISDRGIQTMMTIINNNINQLPIGDVQTVNNVAPINGNITLTTSNITEGTNLYYANQKVTDYILTVLTGNGDILYRNGDGNIARLPGAQTSGFILTMSVSGLPLWDVKPSYSLNELTDVNINQANADKMVLIYNNAAQEYRNRLLVLDDLDDVDLAVAPTNNQVLTYDNVSATWKAQNPQATAVTFPLLATNGSQAAPSYSFAAATNTGIYYNGNIAFSIGNVTLGWFGTDFFQMSRNGAQYWGPGGGQITKPQFSFRAGGGTGSNAGLYFLDTQVMGISYNGVSAIEFDATRTKVNRRLDIDNTQFSDTNIRVNNVDGVYRVQNSTGTQNWMTVGSARTSFLDDINVNGTIINSNSITTGNTLNIVNNVTTNVSISSATTTLSSTNVIITNNRYASLRADSGIAQANVVDTGIWTALVFNNQVLTQNPAGFATNTTNGELFLFTPGTYSISYRCSYNTNNGALCEFSLWRNDPIGGDVQITCSWAIQDAAAGVYTTIASNSIYTIPNINTVITLRVRPSINSLLSVNNSNIIVTNILIS